MTLPVSSQPIVLPEPRTIGDHLRYSRIVNTRLGLFAVDSVLVVSFALFTAGMAHIIFPLKFTPVPITGQTMAVLLSGAVLGSLRGALSQITYMVLGFFFPFYSNGGHGVKFIMGATGGYIIGFIIAAAVVGYLAETGRDRHVAGAFFSFLVGTVIIYVCGSIWLAYVANIPYFSGEKSALALGVIPFLIGDMFKIVAASCALPAGWKIIEKIRGTNKS